MDYIEQLFGISPDGGSGVIEFMLIAAPLVGLGLLVRWLVSPKRRS